MSWAYPGISPGRPCHRMVKIRPTVVITRPEGAYAGAEKLRAKLEAIECRPFFLPVTKVEQLSLLPEAKALVRKALETPDQWIAFLSPSSVYVFKNLVERILHTTQIPPSISLAAQGKGTAEAIQTCFGRPADFIPTVFVAEDFAQEFARSIDEENPILVPQSADGRDVFGPLLRSLGFKVETIDTYCLVDAPLTDELRAKMEELRGLDASIIFMSPSAVRSVVRAFKDHRTLLEGFKVISVGPVTSQAITESGLQVFAEALEHSEDGIIEELKKVTR